MKQLSDLMEEAARADAPPLRHTVDDVVSAGKRRTRRRAVGWASVAAVAVVAAIGVPQAALHRAEPAHPFIAPATSAPPTATSPKVAFTFKGFTAGKFRVADPYGWDLDQQGARIFLGAEEVGYLNVYRPGVDPRRRYFDQGVATGPVRGRPAFVLTSRPTPPLIWQYAPGAWAELEPADRRLWSDLRPVVEAFQLSLPYDVSIPFRSAFAFKGFQITSVSLRSHLALVQMSPTSSVRRALADPDYKIDGGDPSVFIDITDRVDLANSDAECKDGRLGRSCYRKTADGRYLMSVVAPSSSKGEVAQVLGGLSPTDLGNPATWVAVDEAFPASALPGAG
ncbi:hypothetical protein ACGFJ7_41755 [Actinoplanes sp. NPDC048988]|uniref:hypothetical protein n=1 Tax=Actinoplanes sp. NPDC048988 TaxID=3363901 RepID=UPI003713053C